MTASSAAPDPLPFRRPDLPVEDRVADLLARLTTAEKIDQLHQCGIGDTNPNNLAARADEFRPTYGSFILNGEASLATRNALQERCLTGSRLGIPAIFGADVIHGYRTIVPIPLAQACAWNPELMRRACASAAAMAYAQGVDWTFAPMVDFCTDPRWGRIAETFGESPHAGAVYAAASVEGYQGPHPGTPGSIAACLKHYVGYGASEGGRDYSYTDVPAQRLWEFHLPAYEAGVHAGALSVMSAFNDLSGVPASANHYTLTEILRQRWGFRGLVVSDWNSVLQLIRQGHAADEAEAARLALQAGVDLDMADGLYRKHLPDLLAAGRVSMAELDEAVRRVLRVKFQLGLFEHPLTAANALTGSAPTADQLALAEEFAAQSIVLLENRGALPLAAAARKIALIGPLATNGAALLGSWAQQGRGDETPTLADALQARLPAGATLTTLAGCGTDAKAPADLAGATALAAQSDVVILCLGEEAWMSGENASRSTLRLPGRQEELARAVLAAGKPVVLVIVSGRPVELSGLNEQAAAVVAAWQPGSRGGAALADILLGRRNPSGRLAVTWPRTTGQIPLYHNMRPRARPGNEGAYQDIPTTPLYPFGHGLSYTTFAYGPLKLSSDRVAAGGRLVAEVTVTNTGTRDGDETVLWFIRDPAASITRPLLDLKHFEKAAIAAGASRTYRFEIVPERDLSFPDADGRRLLEPGLIVLHAGPSQAEFHVGP